MGLEGKGLFFEKNSKMGVSLYLCQSLIYKEYQCGEDSRNSFDEAVLRYKSEASGCHSFISGRGLL